MASCALVMAASRVLVGAPAVPDLWFWGSASEASISAIAEHRSQLAGANVLYSIGGCGSLSSNGSFVPAGNATKIAWLRSEQIEVHAIMGGGSIASLRRLFAAPDAFITEAVAHAAKMGLAGAHRLAPHRRVAVDRELLLDQVVEGVAQLRDEAEVALAAALACARLARLHGGVRGAGLAAGRAALECVLRCSKNGVSACTLPWLPWPPSLPGYLATLATLAP